MSSVTGTLRRLVLRIPQRATLVCRRGFRCGDDVVRDRIEAIGRTFVAGYHAALGTTDAERLAGHLDRTPAESRGWAYEGAGLGLAVADGLAPWRAPSLAAFLDGPGRDHAYMVHVGAGWALDRFRRHTWATLTGADPLLAWLALDGYGFRAGYFRWRRYERGGAAPAWLSEAGCRVFDQGLGRSLWFVGGADPAWIGTAIDAFAEARRADLWSGVGLACAYAGGVERAVVERVAARSGPHRSSVAQGAAFAAKARLRAKNPDPHTDLAVGILCGVSTADAAAVTDAVHDDLPGNGAIAAGEAYEQWRAGVRAKLAAALPARAVAETPA